MDRQMSEHGTVKPVYICIYRTQRNHTGNTVNTSWLLSNITSDSRST